jgi:hypothetical protein
MKINHLMIVVLAWLSTSSNAAEIEEVLQGINQLRNVIQQGNTYIPSLPPPNHSARLAVSNAEEYCAALQNNQLIKSYSEAMAEASKAGAFGPVIDRYLDSSDRLLTRWVEKQMSSLVPETQWVIYGWANECAYKLKDSNYIYVFEVGRQDALSNRMAKYSDEQKNAPAKREIDAQGNIVMIKNGNKSLPDFIDKPGHASIASTPEWGGLFALALPNGVEVMQKISSNRPQEISAAAAESDQEAKRHAAARQLEEEKAKAAKKAQEESEAKAEALANTPDAKLTHGYKTFQLIEKCVEVRKGYAVVYFSDAEYSDAKNKIKQIENKLKGTIKASTDQLWADAAKINNESLEYKYMGNISYERGRQWCNTYRLSLNELATGIIGKQAPAKSF